MMSWQDHHRRTEIIDGVLAEVADTGRAEVPARWHRRIAETFGSVDAFLGALHYRWLNTLTARLDAVCENPAGEPGAAVRRELAATRPALWALLCAYSAHPALALARAVEERRCGWAGTDPAWWAPVARAPLGDGKPAGRLLQLVLPGRCPAKRLSHG